jgi:predicted dehydrogenase
MATNLPDAQRVIDGCRKNNTRLAVNHIRRWSPDYSKIKTLIKNGIIGEIRHLYFSCGSTGIGNFAIHFFDTARYLTESEPDWAIGFLDTTGTPNPRGKSFVDPGGYAVIRFKNGVRFFIDTSEDTGVQYSFQIVGTYGRIIIDELNGSWEIRARNTENKTIPLTRYGTVMDPVPFTSEENFDIVRLTSRAMAELLSGSPISSTGDDGKKSLEMVIAIHLSDDAANAKVSFPVREKGQIKDVKIA